VVFLEYDVNADFSTRSSRWWAAYGGGYVSYPYIMVDSGNQYSSGPVNFYAIYKEMVDNSLLRSPQAAIEAYAWRDDDHVGFYVLVKNFSGVTLSADNTATVHGIVYEDSDAGVTSRYVRAAASAGITDLAPLETGTFAIETGDLEGVNWEKLHFVVLVDYVPPWSAGAFDMLQAGQAVLISSPFDVQPDPVGFLIDPDNPTHLTRLLDIQGAAFLSWTASESIPWLSVSPESGSFFTQPAVTIDVAALTPGMQQGVITFTTQDGYFSEDVNVNVYYGPLEQRYLPLVHR